MDNLATGLPSNLPEQANLTSVEGTIADRDWVNRVFDEFRPTHVVHSAASYKDPDNWVEDIQTNVLGTANVVQAAQRHAVKRLIYFQTALCYGKPQEHPITLNHPVVPFTSYSISKTAGENYVALGGLPYVSLRLANIYGSRHFSGPMPAFYKRLKAGQKCTIVETRRDFLEIEDFLALLDAILADNSVSGAFNVSSGKDVTIKEIYDRMVERMKPDPKPEADVIRPGEDDVSSLLLDPSETERKFNWKARVPLEEGLDRLIAWYDEHGVEASYTHLSLGKKD
jgi:nucleoside-diphosphate-sugar epimerase